MFTQINDVHGNFDSLICIIISFSDNHPLFTDILVLIDTHLHTGGIYYSPWNCHVVFKWHKIFYFIFRMSTFLKRNGDGCLNVIQIILENDCCKTCTESKCNVLKRVRLSLLNFRLVKPPSIFS